MKKLLIPIAIVLCLATASVLWFRASGNQKNLTAIQVIPDQPILLVEGVRGAWPHIYPMDSATYPGSFPLMDTLERRLNHLIIWAATFNSLELNPNERKIAAVFSNGGLECDLMLVIPILNGRKFHPEKDVPVFEDATPVTRKRLVNKMEVWDVSYPGKAGKYSMARQGNLFLVSHSSYLIESALISMDKNSSLDQNAAFSQVANAILNDQGQHYFISLPQLATYLSSTDAHLFPFVNEQLKSVADWVAFSTLPASNVQLFNGYVSSARDENFLSKYIQASSSKTDLTSILPASTMFYHECAPGATPVILLDDQLAIDEYDQVWRSWAGQSWANVANCKAEEDIRIRKAFLLHTENTEDAMNRLNGLSDSTGLQYKSVAFGHMLPSKVLAQCAGMREGVYYTTIGDYVLFAPELAQIKNYIDAVLNKRTWSQKNIAARADSVLLSAWNQLFFLDLDALGTQQTKLNKKESEIIDNWSPLIVQLNPHNGLFILNAFLFRNAGTEAVEPTGWIAEADAGIQAGPFVLYNQLTREDGIVIQDSLNQMYLLDMDGDIRWKRQMIGPVVGSITMVDFYQNNKYQMLFCTSEAIHLLDMRGDDVEGFPIRLSSAAISGVSAIDYERNGDYRMFVGCENGSIYGFYKNGRPLKGWKPLKAGVMATSMENMLSAGKDYLFFQTVNNTLVAKNRKGDNRFKPVAIPGDLLCYLVPDKSKDPDYLIALKATGQLFRIDLKGETALLSFAAKPHSAAIGDLNGDGVVEIVYANSLGIFATTLKGETLYTFDPGDPLSYEVSLLGEGKKKKVVITSLITGKTFLLDEKGNPSDDEPFPTAGHVAWTDETVPMFLIAKNKLLQAFVIE